MKLRNKLIPLGTVAVAMPIALSTSCGISIDAIIDVPSHNMLKEYENHVRPLSEKTIVGTDSDIGNQYINEINYETDALKDDIMFTIATSLTKAKTTIEKTYKFTKYQLNIRDIYTNTNKQLFFKVESKIAGELVTPTTIAGKNIKSFDMYFQAWMEDGWTAKYYGVANGGVLDKQQIFYLTPVNSLTGALLHVCAWGTYTESGKTEAVTCKIDQVIKDPSTHTTDYAAWPLFNAFYSIPSLATSTSETGSFILASSYFKNVKITKTN